MIATRIVRPVQQFVRTEAAGGIVLVVAAVLAVLWANSPWDDSYFDLLHREFVFDFSWLDIEKDLHGLINEGLMTIFFFMVGLEIKRELVHGELASRNKAFLPVVAALGGMVVPAGIYLAFNAGGDADRGWGIPMATDIAFALGVLALLGSRVPFGVKVFLLALAIADDLGAIVVIALFYTEEVSGPALAIAFVLLLVVFGANRAGLRSMTVYWALGAFCWLAVFESGVHATLAGVALATLTPARPDHDRGLFASDASLLLGDYEDALARGDHEEADIHAARIEQLSLGTESPLDRLEHALLPWVNFVVVPLFAITNAGLRIDGEFLSDAVQSSVSIGVGSGLLIGKGAGITIFTLVAVWLGLGALPKGMTIAHLVGVSVLGGIGFTVSLFITDLAFTDAQFQGEAKAGVFAASIVAAVLGLLILRILTPSAPKEVEAEP